MKEKKELSKTNFLNLNLTRYFFLLIIPGILLFSSLESIKSISKNWYGGGYDPSYAYLYNSLNIATLKQPGHIDHPGTPMQIIGGVILRSVWIINPDVTKANLAEAVISEPEHYLNILNVGVAVLGSFSILIAGLFVSIFSGNLWYGFILQATPFISTNILYTGFLRISQESVLMIACILLAAFILFWYFKHNSYSNNYFSKRFGIIAGFGIASKIIFLPLIIIPFLILPKRQDRIRLLKITVITFIICTLPIILLYPNMGWWFIKLFIHSGIYGSGSMQIIEPGTYLSSLKELLIAEKIYFIGFLLTMASAVYLTALSIIKKKPIFTPTNKLLLSVSIVLIAGFLITAKHPKVAYLLPYICIMPVAIIVIIDKILSNVNSGTTKTILTIGFQILLVIFIVNSGLSRKKMLFSQNKKPVYEQTWKQITELSKGGALISVNPGSSPASANFFANAYSRNSYSELLTEYYPDYYIFDTYTERLVNWRSEEIYLADLAVKYDNKIVLLGDDTDHVISVLTKNNNFSFEIIPTGISEVAVLKTRQ